jgi:hypothetical protein
VIGLGLRMTLAGGKEAAGRLAIIGAAVALGVGLLLATLAAINATNTQNDRYAWIFSGPSAGPATASSSTADPLWFAASSEMFDGKLIGRIDVAATGPLSPVPPGLSRLPRPGEFYASPALTRLLGRAPAAQLGDRYPGRQVGTVGSSALPGPDSLIIVIGRQPGEVSGARDAAKLTAFRTTPPSQCNGCPNLNANGETLVLYVAATALVFPVLILIGMATRLAAARREQRFAAIRLIGATPGQISRIATVESTVAAVLGVAAGFVLFLVAHPLLGKVNFTGTPFFGSDLWLTGGDVLLVIVGIPVLAAIAARVALRRVRISPLGVSRRVTPRPPGIWRLIPLAVGLGIFVYYVDRIPKSTVDQIRVYSLASFLILGGLVLAGPWLTMVGARLMARRTVRPALLVAGRRLSDDPKAGFRAVSGLALALCVTTGAIAMISTINAERFVWKGSASVSDVMVANLVEHYDKSWNPIADAAPPAAAILDELHGIDGVRGVTVIHSDPLGTPDPTWSDPVVKPPAGGLALCSDLSTMPAFSTCAPGAETAAVPASFESYGFGEPADWPKTWAASTVPAERLAKLPALEIDVRTNGSKATVEKVRTVLLKAYPHARSPATFGEQQNDRDSDLGRYQQLVDVVVVVSLVIAGFSLAVGVAGGLSERKRPFSLLRLTGVQLSVLRHVVLLESAVPLLVTAAVAIGTGLLAAHLFLRAQYQFSLDAPHLGFWLLIGTGLALSLAVIASTLPLLRRITGPESARND